VQLSITKSTEFQGRLDEFSNVYRFTGVTSSPAPLQALADKMVALERPIFSNQVNFKRVRIWEDNNLVANTMLITQDLTDVGGAPAGNMYKECAIMLRYPLPFRTAVTSDLNNSVKRVSRYLRKYLHTCAAQGYSDPGNGSGYTPPVPSALQTYATAIVEPLAGVQLCAPNGDTPTGPHKFHPYVEHRQFPRGRKE
jgi:hypothetical protein